MTALLSYFLDRRVVCLNFLRVDQREAVPLKIPSAPAQDVALRNNMLGTGTIEAAPSLA
jgi:hypothetical protein